MKTSAPKNSPQRLFGEIQLARLRVAKAESQLESAKEQARLARRRRKEAKLAARHAKKQARLAKREVTDAKLALAEVEDKLARSKQREGRTKAVKRPAKKTVVAPRMKTARPAPTRSGKPATATKSTSTLKKVGKSIRRKAKTDSPPVVVPRDADLPGDIIAASGGSNLSDAASEPANGITNLQEPAPDQPTTKPREQL